MPVTVRIPEALRSLTGGADEVQVEAANVRDMIAALEAKHAGIKERICDEKGNVRRFVNIFVSEEDIRFQQNLDTPLAAGSEVSILPAIAGGAAKAAKPAKAAPKGPTGGTMIRRVYLTFSQDTVTKPIIYEMVKKFDVVPNIRGASVTDEVGLLSLEVSGSPEEIENAFKWLRKNNIKVDPIEMNVVEP